jgi:hypothetical protein
MPVKGRELYSTDVVFFFSLSAAPCFFFSCAFSRKMSDDARFMGPACLLSVRDASKM